jgi:predicted RNA binding protein YcfA (HicA-like mRNA interferase family)
MGLKRLPHGSGERHARAFQRLGWERRPKEGKGSHIVVAKGRQRITIPAHPTVKRALLAGLLKRAGIREQEYLDAYK